MILSENSNTNMHLQRIFKLILVPVFLVFSQGIQAQISNVYEEYCNDRFDFCLKYPSDVFLQKNISTNEDGLVLRSADDDLRLRVYGYHNVLNNDASTELDNYIDMVRMGHEGKAIFRLEEERSDKNAFAVIRVGRLFYFVRTVYKGEDMIGLTLEINRKKDSDIETAKRLTEQMIKEISL